MRDRNRFDFLWIEDFPLFSPAEDGSACDACIICGGAGGRLIAPSGGKLVSTHHPFTAPYAEDAHLLTTHPHKVVDDVTVAELPVMMRRTGARPAL